MGIFKKRRPMSDVQKKRAKVLLGIGSAVALGAVAQKKAVPAIKKAFSAWKARKAEVVSINDGKVPTFSDSELPTGGDYDIPKGQEVVYDENGVATIKEKKFMEKITTWVKENVVASIAIAVGVVIIVWKVVLPMFKKKRY